MRFRKSVKVEAGLQIELQALHSTGIDRALLFDEGGHGLISSLPILLIEQCPQLRFEKKGIASA